MKTTKVCKPVCFYLVNGVKIIGTLHLPPHTRLTETMNLHFAQKPFLPLTEAKVIEPGEEAREYPFVVLNKNQIVFCFPAG